MQKPVFVHSLNHFRMMLLEKISSNFSILPDSIGRLKKIVILIYKTSARWLNFGQVFFRKFTYLMRPESNYFGGEDLEKNRLISRFF